ncbi:MAG: FAD-binding protein [Gammaproteobacteria bacterium]|jgi:succinate dehydrogenase/fumarate reductase flavoprotein subunit|nr:FAD-binding protein [Gammaproteobacteria bacterium]
MNEKNCDILVIGGGSAGVTAAIYAAEADASVILLSKDNVSYGNSRIIGGTMVYGEPNMSAEQQELLLRDMVVGGDYLSNQHLCKMFANETQHTTPMFERMGGVMNRDEDGNITTDSLIQHGGHSWPRCIIFPNTGPGLGQGLRYGLNQTEGINILEKTMVYDLLRDGNKVTGAVCYELKTGKILVIYAKQVILTTGGGGWMYYPYTDNSQACTGDGYALALMSGAELVDMEQIQFIPYGLTHPPGLAGIAVAEPSIASPAGKLTDAKGREILANPGSKTRAQVANAICMAVARGDGTEHGGCLLDLKGNKTDPKSNFMYKQYTKGIFKIYNNLVRKAYGAGAGNWDEPWDVYPTSHYFMGGIVIDEWGKVKGTQNLYACGEVAGGIHGGNRLAGNAITESLIFGKRAAKKACEQAAKQADCKADTSLVESTVAELQSLPGRSGKYRIVELKRELQNTMWEKAGPVRTEEQLKQALDTFDSIEGRLPAAAISDQEKYNTELLDAMELRLMLPVAKSIAASALARTESRGSHIRMDYQERNDQESVKNIFVKVKNNQVEVCSRAVDLCFISPQQEALRLQARPDKNHDTPANLAIPPA